MLKKIHILLLCAVLFAACEGEAGLSGAGTGSTLNECIMPSSVPAGSEVVVQWNGFRDYAELFLVSENDAEYQMDPFVITESGLIFRIPSAMPSGVYELVLEQDGRTVLGCLEILDAEIPFTGLEVPASAVCGEVTAIIGLGFDPDAVVRLVSASGEDFFFEVSLTLDGISFIIPEDMAAGEYELYVVQDGKSWLLSSSFRLTSVAVSKTLDAIRYYTPYIGATELMISWEISRDEPVALTVSQFIVEAGTSPELNCYDRYVATSESSFVLDYDGFEESNDLEMSYGFDDDGLVSVSDVLLYGDDETTNFKWTYDADGMLTEISANRSFASFEYEDGCLTAFRNVGFAYSNPSLKKNPDAPDVIWAYMALIGRNDPFMYIPYLLGWYKGTSELLPTEIKEPDPSGSGSISCPVSYIFDSDGYVIEMSWLDSGAVSRVEFDYLTGVIE